MPDYKITELTENTTPALGDMLPMVDDPAGTPVTKKSTIQSILSLIYPVGSIYISVVSTNPGTLFGGTWTAFGAGKTLVGLNASETEFDTVEETGGAKTHTLQTTEIPSHTHSKTQNISTTGANADANYMPPVTGTVSTTRSFTTDATGGGGSHNNLQPYIVVYMWKRTA